MGAVCRQNGRSIGKGKSMSEPVWNKFLSERDKQVFAAAGYATRQGFGHRPAILVVDVNYAFFGSPLLSFLVLLGADSLIIAGTTTSGCVRATVVDAFSNNYRVAIVEEGCFDRSQASHALSLCDMNAKYADVIGLEETLAYIEALPKGLFKLPAGGAAGLRKVG